LDTCCASHDPAHGHTTGGASHDLAHAMTLRARIAAVAGLAVALAVLVAALSLYLAVRSDLRGEIDKSLSQRAAAFVSPPAVGSSGPQ
jgi:hypothetical protein